MKSETASVTLTAPAPKRSAVWKATLILIPIVTAVALFWLRQVQVNHLSSRTLPSLGTSPKFDLVNQDAQPFGSEQLAGKIWIADFIFTTCPGPCPIISTRMSELQRPLEKTDIHLVSFTIDPEKDTPEVLRAYAEKLNARPERWDFLTGPRDTIWALMRDSFKLTILEDGGEDGALTHSRHLVLLDRQGAIRGYYDALAPDAVTKLLADANHLFREQPAR